MSEIVLVNVGCGMSPTEGAVNIDNSKTIKIAQNKLSYKILRNIMSEPQRRFCDYCLEHKIYYGTCERLPIKDETVDVLYTSHMFEHLSVRTREKFFSEIRRVMKPEGIVRVVIPDTKVRVDNYLDSGDCDAFIESLFLSLKDYTKNDLLIKGFRGHYWMWDEKSISKLFESAGFYNVTILKPGETTIPFETRIDLKERAGESIYVEFRCTEC